MAGKAEVIAQTNDTHNKLQSHLSKTMQEKIFTNKGCASRDRYIILVFPYHLFYKYLSILHAHVASIPIYILIKKLFYTPFFIVE
jgi:hypothetical protein